MKSDRASKLAPHQPIVSPHRWPLIGVLAIVLLTLVAYIPAMSAGFIWDDDAYITDNALVKSADGLGRIWVPRETPQYYPMVFTMFWAEYRIWADNPVGYHLINIALHILNALLAWKLCTRIGLPGGASAAWLVGAVFALHPVHVESVAWVTERKNVLSGFFYLASMLAYLRFDEAGVHRESASGSTWKWYVLAHGLFVLALLSKSVTCSLPAALILIMLYQRKPLVVRRLVPLVPFFAIGLTLALHTAQLEREHVGAEGIRFAFSVAERLIIASQALLFYPLKIVFPWPLVFIYPRWEIDAGSAVSYWAMAIVVILIIAAAMSFFRWRRGPALALAFYAGTIFPALGFFNIYPMLFSFVADHFQYLASLGVIVLLVSGIFAGICSGWRLLAVAVAPLMIFAMLTVHQTSLYQSPITLWEHTLSWNEASWMPHNNMSKELLMRGYSLRAAGRENEAKELLTRGYAHLARAMELNPGLQADVLATDWNMHALLAAHYQKQAKFDLAVEHYRLFLSRVPGDTNVQLQYAFVLESLAGQLAEQRIFDRALELGTEAHEIFTRLNRADRTAPLSYRLEAYRAGRAK